MKTIQVVLDDELLRAADREAKRERANRSEIIRRALRDHLARRKLAALEEQHRRSYEAHPALSGEFDVWDAVAAWPED